MKRMMRGIAFLVAILLSGYLGYAAAVDWLPQFDFLGFAEPAAMQLDVDLTEMDKQHETEPEENPSPQDIEVEIIPHEREEGKPLRVLIYHTHTYEAYEPAEKGEYKQTERWRTADPEHNVVRVGKELAGILQEEYGMQVVHDDTAFEPPKLDSAYQRSLEALENYMARGETFDLYLDIHRDAASEGYGSALTIDGEQVARLMFLIGKGTGTYMGQAFAQKPDWEKNLQMAERMTALINAEAEGLCYPVAAKSSRYNQHISTGALLIEVGNNLNSLSEALNAVPYLARAIAEAMAEV